MAVEIANAVINLTPSLRGMGREIERQVRGVDTRRAGAQAGDGYTSGFKGGIGKLTGILGGAFAAVKIGSFAKDAIAEASDLNEVSTKLTAIFGDSSKEIQAFGAQGAKALGQTSLQAQNAAATFGTFGKAAGLSSKENAAFSTELAKLATDMASFSNTTPEQAIEALGAGLRGESEPLRQYGVLLDDATLRNEALAMGLITTTKDALTPQQKVLASHAVIMKQTADAQGDFERTSGGLANQQRILSATWTDGKAALGKALLPAVTSGVHALNNFLGPAIDKSIAGFEKFYKSAQDMSVGVSRTVAPMWRILMTGDVNQDIGTKEVDTGIARALVFANDTFGKVKMALLEAWNILSGKGAFKGDLSSGAPLVTFMENIRSIGLGVFDKLRNVWDQLWSLGEKLWPSIQSIAKSFFDAWQTINNSGWSVFGLVFDGIKIAIDGVIAVLNNTLVPALDWLARFFRENPAEVYILVGAFTAWKVVTLAISVGQWAVQAATKAWAAAQWLLNAAMEANPITLVIVALAALAAAVVWAYNNVGWFKDAVDAAWTFIKDATSALWEGVLKPAFTWISENIHVVGDAALWLWNNAITPAWNGISTAISWAWTNVIQPVFGFISDNIHVVGDAVSWLWNNIVVPAWNGISGAISTAWGVIQGVFSVLNSAIDGVGGFFSDLWGTVEQVWGWIQDKIGAVWNWINQNVFAPLNLALTTVGSFFTNLWNTVVSVWDNIQNKISTVWNWINQNVFAPLNLGINTIITFFESLWAKVQEIWDNVSGFFGGIATAIGDAVQNVKDSIDEILAAVADFFVKVAGGSSEGGVFNNLQGALAPGGARGAVVPGRDPGRRDNMLMPVRSGESVFVPEFTKAIGGAPTVHAWNRLAEQGRLGEIGMGMARGGVVGLAGAGQTMGTSLGDSILNAVLRKIDAVISPQLAGNSGTVVMNGNITVDGNTAGLPAGPRGEFIKAVASQMGTEYLWGSDQPPAFDCSGLMSWALRSAGVFDGRLTAEGFNSSYPHIQGRGKPGDMVTFDTGRLPGQAGHIGAILDPAKGLMMHTDGAGPARVGDYLSRGGGPLSIVDAIGGTVTPSTESDAAAGDPPSGGLLAGLLAKIKGAFAFGASADPGGSGVERWRPTVLQSLSMLRGKGLDGNASYADIVLNQVRTESSGDPNAINLTDSNARAGHPSIGLVQTIIGTFTSMLEKYGFSELIPRGQRDPLASLVAGELWAIHNYGSIPAGMRGVAYDNGGMFGPKSIGVNLLNKPEAVLTPKETAAYQSHAAALANGFGGRVVINLDSSDPLQVAVGRMIADGVDTGLVEFGRHMGTLAGQSQ